MKTILFILTVLLMSGCTQNTYNINANIKNVDNKNKSCDCCNGYYDDKCCNCCDTIQWTDPDLIDDY